MMKTKKEKLKICIFKDISEKPLFNCFSKIKDFLEKSPSNFCVYICICDKYNLDSDVYIEFVKCNGYQMNHEK